MAYNLERYIVSHVENYHFDFSRYINLIVYVDIMDIQMHDKNYVLKQRMTCDLERIPFKGQFQFLPLLDVN